MARIKQHITFILKLLKRNKELFSFCKVPLLLFLSSLCPAQGLFHTAVCRLGSAAFGKMIAAYRRKTAAITYLKYAYLQVPDFLKHQKSAFF